MNTVWDAVTILMFAALIVLFLVRSRQDDPRDGGVIPYLIPALGLAIVNQLGNRGQLLFALIALGATLWFILQFLRPFDAFRGR